jgi:hypothetical protein
VHEHAGFDEIHRVSQVLVEQPLGFLLAVVAPRGPEVRATIRSSSKSASGS